MPRRRPPVHRHLADRVCAGDRDGTEPVCPPGDRRAGSGQHSCARRQRGRGGRRRGDGCEVAAYPASGSGRSTPSPEQARRSPRFSTEARVAIEAGYLPAALARDIDWVDVSEQLVQARAVKDPDEVELMRASIAVCDAGQAAARANAAPGISELDLWAEVRGAMEAAAETRLPVLADLVSGPRTAEIGGPPGIRRARVGRPRPLRSRPTGRRLLGRLVRDVRGRRAERRRA